MAFLTYTSGTTGVPKGAMNTHGNVAFTAQVYRDWTRAGRDGPIFGIAPLFQITGLIGHAAVSLLAPAPLVLAYRFERRWCSTHSSNTGPHSPSAPSLPSTH